MMFTTIARIQNQKEVDTQERIERLAEELLAELDPTAVKQILLNNGGQLIYCPPVTTMIAEHSLEQMGKKTNQKVNYIFISPEGEEVPVSSISSFCLQYFGSAPNGRGRYISSFIDLLKGNRTEDNVHGWKVKLAPAQTV